MLPLHLEARNFAQSLISYYHQGHLPFLGGSPTNPRMVTQIRKCITDLEFGTYTLLAKLIPGDNCHGWSHTIPWRVTRQPKEDGHQPTQGWSPTKRKCTTDLQFGIYTLLTKLTLGDNCYGWSPSIHRMVPHPHKDGHPLEGSVIKTGNLVPRINT